MNYSDEQLIELSQNGDRDAFGELFIRHNQAIYRFVYFRVFNETLAQDIVGDTFMKALQAQHSFDSDKGVFLAWLYRIARNTLFDHFRKTHFDEDISEIQIADKKNLSQEVENNISIQKIKELLDTLPEKQKEIVLLRVWGDLSYAEIAKITSSTESACKMSFSRAIGQIKDKADFISLAVAFYLAKHI